TAAAGDGSYSFYTRAKDKAGNYEAAPATADSSTFVDTVIPTSSASSPAYSSSTPITDVYSPSDAAPSPGLDKVELWVKVPGGGSYTRPATHPPPTSTSRFRSTAAAGDGSYSFYTRAKDKAGNYEAAPATADSSTFVDTVIPTSSASSPAY